MASDEIRIVITAQDQARARRDTITAYAAASGFEKVLGEVTTLLAAASGEAFDALREGFKRLSVAKPGEPDACRRRASGGRGRCHAS